LAATERYQGGRAEYFVPVGGWLSLLVDLSVDGCTLEAECFKPHSFKRLYSAACATMTDDSLSVPGGQVNCDTVSV